MDSTKQKSARESKTMGSLLRRKLGGKLIKCVAAAWLGLMPLVHETAHAEEQKTKQEASEVVKNPEQKSNLKDASEKIRFLNQQFLPEAASPETKLDLDFTLSTDQNYGKANLVARLARIDRTFSVYLGAGGFVFEKDFYSLGESSNWNGAIIPPPSLAWQRHGGHGILGFKMGENGRNLSFMWYIGGNSLYKIVDGKSEKEGKTNYHIGSMIEFYPIENIGIGLNISNLPHDTMEACFGAKGRMPLIKGPAEIVFIYRSHGVIDETAYYHDRHFLELSGSVPLVRVLNHRKMKIWLNAVSPVRMDKLEHQQPAVSADAGLQLHFGQFMIKGGYTFHGTGPFIGLQVALDADNPNRLLRTFSMGGTFSHLTDPGAAARGRFVF